MPFVDLERSSLVPGPGPVPIYYRDAGAGDPPLVFLHGGWGYEIYPFDAQIAAFAGERRIVVPDRSGYGRSPRLARLPPDFHRRAADETLAVLDALGIRRALVWGHSDGAVIGAILGLVAPARVGGLVLEAFHADRAKPSSRAFFAGIVADPERIGARARAVLERDHGPGRWRDVVRSNGEAWLAIAATSAQPERDLYGGRLPELSVPTLFLHGRRDPRTEPGEIETVGAWLPRATVRLIEDAGHGPHSEPLHAEECSRLAREFFATLARPPPCLGF